MKRREFIAGLRGAAAWPLVARAQQAGNLPTIGYLGDDALSWSPWTARFVERLRELGWSDGQNISIEYRWSNGRPERIGEIAAEFVQQNVNVIVTYGAAVAGLKQATAAIPIVFAIAVDPVGSGIVASLSRPGGNVTGLSVEQSDIAGKRLELLREIVPGLRRLAIIFDGGYAAAMRENNETQAAARIFGLMSSHMPFDMRRILRRLSKPLSPKPMLSTLQSMPSLMQTVSKSRGQRLARGCRRHSMKAVVSKLVGLCRMDQIFQISSGALLKSSTRYFAEPNLVIFLLSSPPNSRCSSISRPPRR